MKRTIFRVLQAVYSWMSVCAEVIDSIEEVECEKWNNFLEQTRFSDIFHTHEWLRALEEGADLVPRHILVTKSGGVLGCMPNFIERIRPTHFKRLSSLRPGHGGPVILSHEKKVLDAMMEEVDELCGGFLSRRVFSHRIFSSNTDYLRYVHYLKDRGYSLRVDYSVLRFDLSLGWDDILEGMDKTRRYNMKKEPDEGIKIYDDEIEDKIIPEFSNTYRTVLKRVGGIIYPQKLYRKIGTIMGDKARIFMAKKNNVFCGGWIGLLDYKTDTLRLVFGGVLKEFFKYNLPELMMRYVIKWGIKKGFKYLDYGGMKSDFNDGLFKFKDHFGGEILPFLHWEKGHTTIPWNILEKGYNLIYA